MSFLFGINKCSDLKVHNGNWGSRGETWGWPEEEEMALGVLHSAVKESCVNTSRLVTLRFLL